MCDIAHALILEQILAALPDRDPSSVRDLFSAFLSAPPEVVDPEDAALREVLGVSRVA